jgi:hypothetical protein
VTIQVFCSHRRQQNARFEIMIATRDCFFLSLLRFRNPHPGLSPAQNSGLPFANAIERAAGKL